MRSRCGTSVFQWRNAKTTSSSMETALTPLSDRPCIVAVGFHRLKDLLRELAPSYGDVARVEVLDRGFEEAVAEIEALRRLRRIDVLVAAGSNGAFLRQRLDLPVVLVRVGGFDVMRALGRARDISPR